MQSCVRRRLSCVAVILGKLTGWAEHEFRRLNSGRSDVIRTHMSGATTPARCARSRPARWRGWRSGRCVGCLRRPELVARTITEVRRQNAAEDAALEESEVIEALGALEPVWDELYPAEQARILRLLVERIDVAPDGISVTLHAAGIRSLVAELAAAPKPRRDPGQGARPRASLAAADRERSGQVDHRPCGAGGRRGRLCLPAPAAHLPSADIMEAILDGRQPKGLRLAEMLGNGPVAWEEQRGVWGCARSSASCS
jgi:hypothetical protein